MYNDFEELKSGCLNCGKCALAEMRTNVVFGVGNENAEVMFVGEGPGENEDLRGEPFVGRGGQLLDKMLRAVHLDRTKNIYITNIVKCRPPGNRDPKPDEIADCFPYLDKQIELIRPRIIVCLGRHAAQKLIGEDFKITREHGKWYKYNNALIMGMFHPAFILRNQGQKAPAFADFLALRDKIKELGLGTYRDAPEEEAFVV
ncbi:MAG: uracil-DNA glycosylase [Oscillospiraceae bacterium]|nr:uracil-DNA glycosylase [Oscillospiraceae bacterium]